MVRLMNDAASCRCFSSRAFRSSRWGRPCFRSRGSLSGCDGRSRAVKRYVRTSLTC